MNTSGAVPVAQTLSDLSALVDNLLLLLSDKEKVVIKKRFDIDNNGKFTLEEIGGEFSVTRERIRQIERNALSKMRRNVFNTALRHLHDFVTEHVNESGGLVKEDDLLRNLEAVLPGEFKVDSNCIHLSLVLHDSLKCVGNTIHFHPYVRETDLTDFSLKFASNQLVNQLHKYGDVKNIEKIHADLKPVLDDIDFDLAKVRSLIAIDKRVTLLDDDLVALLEWRHIHPRTLRDKILYTFKSEKKPLHFSKIAEKITAANFDNRSVNLQAVHNELIRHGQFILIGRGIYALQEWGFVKGTVVEVIERIMADARELSEEEIVDEVLKQRQVKKITILLALKNNERFERVGRKRYKLNV